MHMGAKASLCQEQRPSIWRAKLNSCNRIPSPSNRSLGVRNKSSNYYILGQLRTNSRSRSQRGLLLPKTETKYHVESSSLNSNLQAIEVAYFSFQPTFSIRLHPRSLVETVLNNHSTTSPALLLNTSYKRTDSDLIKDWSIHRRVDRVNGRAKARVALP
jgi:hypothetical protein